eukprot:scaffold28710_cov71-Cyclotella_meneghiniana.AAC.1
MDCRLQSGVKNARGCVLYFSMDCRRTQVTASWKFSIAGGSEKRKMKMGFGFGVGFPLAGLMTDDDRQSPSPNLWGHR